MKRFATAILILLMMFMLTSCAGKTRVNSSSVVSEAVSSEVSASPKATSSPTPMSSASPSASPSPSPDLTSEDSETYMVDGVKLSKTEYLAWRKVHPTDSPTPTEQPTGSSSSSPSGNQQTNDNTPGQDTNTNNNNTDNQNSVVDTVSEDIEPTVSISESKIPTGDSSTEDSVNSEPVTPTPEPNPEPANSDTTGNTDTENP
jgi:hypothetical protein